MLGGPIVCVWTNGNVLSWFRAIARGDRAVIVRGNAATRAGVDSCEVVNEKRMPGFKACNVCAAFSPARFAVFVHVIEPAFVS